jgi:hypothetical protein
MDATPVTLVLEKKDMVGMHISRIRRYEGGRSQLIFEKDERGPDDDLRLHFEAASRLDPDTVKPVSGALPRQIPEEIPDERDPPDRPRVD